LFLAVDAVRQGLAFHKRHHVEQEPVGFPRIEERQDVRMLQIRRRLDLCQEALGTYDGGQLGLQHLQSDFALML
jgi:hypothetical protein